MDSGTDDTFDAPLERRNPDAIEMSVLALRVRYTMPDGAVMELGEFESLEEALAATQRHVDRIANDAVSEPLIWCSDVSGTETFTRRGATRYSITVRGSTGIGYGTRSVDND